ncbi:MAG: 3-phosphoshikimate 1-carboxyvinyltransferase [Lachnospiraceae bacterium]|nr:3-phosphoshikimate 1-carboxyvinyltransferase [Lachnospiraceae bacterium]
MNRVIKKSASLKGEFLIPGDKSISHRAVMFGSLASGITEASNFLMGADCLSTIGCFKAMGVDIEVKAGGVVTVKSNGLHSLKKPDGTLDCGNSGTTTRLISGILSGQNFDTRLTGDASIQKRPMKRVIEPLTMMGADITSEFNNGCAPLIIKGHAPLKAIHYESKVASAQVKSCVLLAGLYADGITKVTEPVLSRNHTELMLKGFGANITSEGTTASIEPDPVLYGQKLRVPGDISSAAYFIAAGLLVPGSEIVLKGVGLNPTRAGIIEIAKAMGGDIRIENEMISSGEPVGDIVVKASSLHGTTVGGEIIPTLIDEIPIIAVMAAFADGETIIKDAAELKVKETDRIATVCEGLKALGADVTPTDEGMIIRGGKELHPAKINSYLDHRVAMSFAVAGMCLPGETEIVDADCVDISFPDFYNLMNI